jgi:very-short-patch-repair endonuclease
MSPYYTPPYDSPIEDKFAYHATKYLLQDLQFHTQYEVITICGKFVVDFVAISPSGKKIGIECDGKDFHNKARDEWRDAMIMGDDRLDSIYRLRGVDLTYFMNDVLYILSRCEPDLFSQRGHLNIETLASTEIQDIKVEKNQTTFYIQMKDDETDQISHILIERRHKNIPKGKQQFWQNLYAFAKSQNGGILDEIIATYKKNYI